MMLSRIVITAAVVLVLVSAVPAQQTREEKVLEDRRRVEAERFWIYNDLAKGLDEARATGKPVLVSLRCIPCEACVKLDEELMEQDPVLKPLLDKFVRVRLVGTNGLDLNLFQYDYDQSFAILLMNADQTIYGRYGTRSHRTEWSEDVSLAGLAEALQGALKLHENFPQDKPALAAKRGPAPEFSTPEQYPSLAAYAPRLDYEGNVVKSCIHCHMIGDAQREFFRSQGKPIPEQLLFPYPHPKSLGLILDPDQRAVVAEVVEDSPAQLSGFQAGDEILSLQGQPLLSIADVQWVLHHAGDARSLNARVQRDGQNVDVTLLLPDGWREQGDTSWRVSTWPLRRMATGGMKLRPLSDEERAAAKLPQDDKMALLVEHVGQYGPHAAAKQAGFQKGDIIVAYDGRSDLPREVDVLIQGLTVRHPPETVDVTLLRNGHKLTLPLPMQQ
jgi:serine protease Do